jgi:prenyltransferase beta subunit
MKRILLCLLSLLAVATAGAAPLPDDQRSGTARYVHGLMNEDGGYRMSSAAGPSQLEPTRSTLRSLKVLQEDPGDRRGLGLFILSCYDTITGGFSDLPAGPPDVRSTAMGLMALAETRQLRGERPRKAAEYLAKHAKSIPEIYVSLAALEAAQMKPADPAAWLQAFEAMRNPDGTFGKSPYDTATAVVSILRLGGTVQNRDAVVSRLKAAQQPEGGFAGEDDAVGLGGTYRMVRAIRLLKDRPDVAKLREYLAKCRGADHGYGPAPGQPATANATYYALTMLSWMEEMEKQ